MMNIALDRRHVFYLDADDQPHAFPTHLFDRLWRGEPDAVMPASAGQRVRFAVFHVERFTSPPRIVLEHYPVLTLDDRGHVDVVVQQAGLQAEVDALETADYAPKSKAATTDEPTTTWYPKPAIRRRLLDLLRSSTSYRARMTRGSLPSRAEEPRSTYGRGQRRDNWTPGVPQPELYYDWRAVDPEEGVRLGLAHIQSGTTNRAKSVGFGRRRSLSALARSSAHSFTRGSLAAAPVTSAFGL